MRREAVRGRGLLLAGLLAGLLSGLLSGCGLPLPSGARSAGEVPDAAPRGGPVVVLPPGPAEGASPAEVVTGFLAAQTSSAGGYAVARRFLADGVEWDPGAGIEVYDADRPPAVEPPQEEGSSVVVVAPRVASVRSDGSYRRAGGEVVDAYRVGCPDGVCRITDLPVGYGLRLSDRDLLGSFAPQQVHFLAPGSGDTTAQGSLVADLVWLERGEALARRLVEQLVLEGPSSALEGSVGTAVPDGTTVERVREAADGTVTVGLSAAVAALDPAGRERLSAQLVWTLRGLPGFTALRLLAGGRPLAVEGVPTPQPAAAWAAYTPERLRPRAPAFYLADRSLRALDGGLASSPATDGTLPVDAAAVSPDGFLALLTRRPDGTAELRTGPQAGPFGEPRATGELSSPSWGGGDAGVWLVQDGRVLLVPLEGEPVAVPVEGLTRYGPVRQVRASRDGVRVALLTGDREAPSLVVGRVVAGPDGVALAGLREIVPGLQQVADVSWERGTGLVVLSRSTLGLLPTRVAVDGSSVAVSGLRLPEGVELTAVAAAEGRPLLAEGRSGEQVRLLREEGQLLAPVPESGRSPFYPG